MIHNALAGEPSEPVGLCNYARPHHFTNRSPVVLRALSQLAIERLLQSLLHVSGLQLRMALLTDPVSKC
jgi:hypothetical protein